MPSQAEPRAVVSGGLGVRPPVCSADWPSRDSNTDPQFSRRLPSDEIPLRPLASAAPVDVASVLHTMHEHDRVLFEDLIDDPVVTTSS